MKLIHLAFLVSVAFFFAGCFTSSAQKVLDKKPRQASGKLDTAEFHVFNGDEHVQRGEYSEAEESYRRALDVKPTDASALAGLAGAVALSASLENLSAAQKNEAGERSRVYLDAAAKVMSTPSEKERFHSGTIIVNTSLQTEADWFEQSKKAFAAAKNDGVQSHVSKFFMAKAFVARGNYAAAENLYREVISGRNAYSRQADLELIKVHKIQRAKPGNRFGSKIAGAERVTRSEVAALLVADFNLAALYKQKIMAYNQKFLPPEHQQGLKTKISTAIPDAIDIQGLPHQRDIETVLELKLRGLEADPAHKFHPNEPMLRSEFALLVEDLLIKITGDNRLKTRYIGSPSPYRDVRSDIFYYNAVRIVVERTLMHLTDKVASEFSPDEPVSGADAILAVRELKIAVESALR